MQHTARTCERFVYSIVKITTLYDYQTWWTISEKFMRCAKDCGLCFLDCAFQDADWLAGKLRPHGCKQREMPAYSNGTVW